MKNSVYQYVILFFVLAFFQISIFNRIYLFGYATPLLYSYFLIKLPVRLNRNAVILLAAALGLTVDIFSYTLGLNMLTMVLTGFVRYWLISLFVPKDITENESPSFRSFGKTLFMRYASFMVLTHIILLFTLETLSLLNPFTLLLRIGSSFLLTISLVYALEHFYEKR